MTEILCNHRWGDWAVYYECQSDPDKRMRVCSFCKTWQTEGDVEPEVTIGRIR